MFTENITMKTFIIIAAVQFITTKSVLSAECKTEMTIIQPQNDIAEDNQKYFMINIHGFVQNASSVECLPDQSCSKGKCHQDYKLHQFLTLPYGKEQFSLSELQFRFFKIPYGCKCSQ